jgi:uncharacterized phage protein (TIGR02218 family)
MTLATNMEDTQQLQMPEFYQLSCGSRHEYWTSGKETLFWGAHDWIAAPIKRTTLSRDNDFGTISITITTFITDLLGSFIANNPIEPCVITIYRALETDLTDLATIFSGVVKDISVKDRQIQVRCEAQAQYLKKKLPKFIYQSFCNHTLFDTGCQANPNLFKVSDLVSLVSGADIIVPAAATKPDGYFIQGKVVADQDIRLILNHVGSTLTLQIPFDSRVGPGTSVVVYAGCDKDPATCIGKFNNFDHFFGFPYIPNKNPVIDGFKVNV